MRNRIVFEDLAHCNALDVTWARFRAVIADHIILRKIKLGKGLDHSDIIESKKNAPAKFSKPSGS